MKIIYRTIGDIILLLHIFIFAVVVFGGFFPQYQNLYLAMIVLTILSDLVFGYCVVSKWEYYFRKKVDPRLNYDFTWTVHYLHKITNKNISPVFYKYVSAIFLILSLGIQLYFRFLL
ncbi:DUF2784 family protein [Patescibacteria group bacterium]|nr:DUF2784 family protein [Patescibacteria group bacterium]